MTEEEKFYYDDAINDIKGKIREDIRMGQFYTERHYLESCSHRISLAYKRRHRFHNKEKAFNNYLVLFGNIEDQLRSDIKACMLSSKKRMMKKEINALSAQCIISERLHEEGIPFHIDAQTYRAKVHVKLSENRKAILYLNYKTLQDDIDDFVIAVRQLKEVVQKFGKFTSLYGISAYDKWE